MPEVQGKVVVVTGGTRGIGLELVRRLLQQGNTVVATGRNPAAAPLGALQQLQQQYGPDTLLLTPLDVSNPNSIAQWAAGLKQDRRISHVDVLINNAAVSLDQPEHRVVDQQAQVLLDSFATNAVGPLLVVKELIQQGLLGGGQPSLAVYISSFAGSCGKVGKTPVFYYQYGYRASKAALNMLVLTSSHELPEHNITSVLMHPGRVRTDMLRNQAHSIAVEESVAGLLQVLQSVHDVTSLNGRFLSYTGEEVPW